jgi:hypothetical protein
MEGRRALEDMINLCKENLAWAISKWVDFSITWRRRMARVRAIQTCVNVFFC